MMGERRQTGAEDRTGTEQSGDMDARPPLPPSTRRPGHPPTHCLMRLFLRGPLQMTASSGLGSMKPMDITPRFSCACCVCGGGRVGRDGGGWRCAEG